MGMYLVYNKCKLVVGYGLYLWLVGQAVGYFLAGFKTNLYTLTKQDCSPKYNCDYQYHVGHSYTSSQKKMSQMTMQTNFFNYP